MGRYDVSLKELLGRFGKGDISLFGIKLKSIRAQTVEPYGVKEERFDSIYLDL